MGPDEIASTIHEDSVLPIRQLEIAKTSQDRFVQSEICDVLVILTGGTIAMVHSDMGYVVAKGLCHRLKAYDKFYDKSKAEELGLDNETLITPPTPSRNAFASECSSLRI